MRTALTISLAAASTALVLATAGRWAAAYTDRLLAGLSIPLPPVL